MPVSSFFRSLIRSLRFLKHQRSFRSVGPKGNTPTLQAYKHQQTDVTGVGLLVQPEKTHTTMSLNQKISSLSFPKKNSVNSYSAFGPNVMVGSASCFSTGAVFPHPKRAPKPGRVQETPFSAPARRFLWQPASPKREYSNSQVADIDDLAEKTKHGSVGKSAVGSRWEGRIGTKSTLPCHVWTICRPY